MLPPDCLHRQAKYLNNRIECDHGKLKRLIRPTLGFQSMCACAKRVQTIKRGVPKAAYATIRGFEVMRVFRKDRFRL